MKMLPATGGRPERPHILPQDRYKHYGLARTVGLPFVTSRYDGFARSVCSGQSSQKPWRRLVVADDYDVRDSHGKVVGRIIRHPQAPKDLPWFWTITAREIPPSVHNRGYSATREQRWRISRGRAGWRAQTEPRLPTVPINEPTDGRVRAAIFLRLRRL
jgi:hypothetical protein